MSSTKGHKWQTSRNESSHIEVAMRSVSYRRARRAGEKPGTAKFHEGEMQRACSNVKTGPCVPSAGGCRMPCFGGVRPKASQTRMFGMPSALRVPGRGSGQPDRWGVWGGMTERERRLLLRQRSDVTSWRSPWSVQLEPASGAAGAVGSRPCRTGAHRRDGVPPNR